MLDQVLYLGDGRVADTKPLASRCLSAHDVRDEHLYVAVTTETALKRGARVSADCRRGEMQGYLLVSALRCAGLEGGTDMHIQLIDFAQGAVQERIRRRCSVARRPCRGGQRATRAFCSHLQICRALSSIHDGSVGVTVLGDKITRLGRRTPSLERGCEELPCWPGLGGCGDDDSLGLTDPAAVCLSRGLLPWRSRRFSGRSPSRSLFQACTTPLFCFPLSA